MKQVKFNLYVDQQKIRTIDELKENFNIDDLIEWYEQGVLQKWLSVRNYDEYLTSIEAIKTKDIQAQAKSIIEIFNFSEQQAKGAMDSLKYRLNYAQQGEGKTTSSKNEIEKYHTRYDEIKKVLLERVK